MWSGVGDGSARALQPMTITMQDTNEICRITAASFTGTAAVSREQGQVFNLRIVLGGILNQEDREVERVVPNKFPAFLWEPRSRRAGLKKVSAQLEVGKAAPQTILNNQ